MAGRKRLSRNLAPLGENGRAGEVAKQYRQENVAKIALSAPPGGNFPKAAHLLKRADFQRVYQQGKRHFSGLMTFFYLPRTEKDALAGGVFAAESAPQLWRVGFTIPKAVGKAVDRNRIRRRVREAVRRQMHEQGAMLWPVDVVINPRRSALEAGFARLEAEVGRALRQICNQAIAPRTDKERQ